MTRLPNPELPERILSVAEKIVAADGHFALNMRRLAKEVGVTPTTLYYYFKSKEHIFVQIKLRTARKLNEKIGQIDPTRDPQSAIRTLGEIYIEFAEDNPHLYRHFMEELLDKTLVRGDEYETLHFSYLAARKMLEDLAAKGLYRDDPRKGAMIGWILLHGFVSLLISGTLESVEGSSKDELKAIFMDFYTPGPPRDEEVSTKDSK
ncbi:MAG: TetR family transcriptional regulator [Candidatus Latescibacteria bacterium]|nr:TetR family transcriptional regulator [Candidatus Latescibacterota bacterium]NIO57259.1 TetR family transcriptional regulator [Candidatus Latescibacterota bacterium]